MISYDNRSYYNNNSSNGYIYYKKLFKQSDLVQYIFQHLDFTYGEKNH